MSDEEIVEMYFARDERAVSETDRAHGKACRSAALNIVGLKEDAEECVSDTYLRVWNSVPPERPSRLRAYLLKICRRLALGRYTQKNAARRGGGEIPAVLDELEQVVSAGNTEADFDFGELVRAVDGFVLGLPEKEAALFVRRYFYCERLKDIAALCGIRENNAAVSLHRIRDRLKEHLTKNGFSV